MAVTAEQAAVQAAAASNPPVGASSGTAGVTDQLTVAYDAWLTGYAGATANIARGAIIAAGSSMSSVSRTLGLAAAYAAWAEAQLLAWGTQDAIIGALQTAATSLGDKVESAAQVTDLADSILARIYAEIGVTSDAITPDPVNLTHPDTQQLTYTLTFADSETRDVTALSTFASDDEGVATVDADGLVTTVAAGSCVITATYGAQSDTVAVTVS